MPYAFAQTGVFLSLATMLTVAVCNDIVTCLMIRAAAYTGLDSYEAMAEWAGGKAARVGAAVVQPPRGSGGNAG